MECRITAYRDGLTAESIDPDGISEALEPPDVVVWIDLVDPDPVTLRSIAAELQLHPVALEDIERRYERPKIDRYDDHVVIVAYGAELDGGRPALHEMTMVLGARFAITVRMASELDRAVADARRRVEASQELREDGSRFIAYCVLDEMVDGYFPVVESFDVRIEAIEESLLTGAEGSDLPTAFAIRRDILQARRVIAPMREVLGVAVRIDQDVFGRTMSAELRDLYDHVLRVYDELETQRELLTGLMDAYQSVVSQRLNDVILQLSAWGAILIVPTLVASIYGMNFVHMPELEWRLGYAYALTLMAALACGLYVLFKRRSWL